MMILKMKKEDLSTFLDAVKEWGELWGPTKKDGKVSFSKVDSLSPMALKGTGARGAPQSALWPGHTCIPDDKCMCTATGTDFIAEGFDLFFTDLKMSYLVWVGSTKGHDLVRMRPDLFSRELGRNDILNYTEYRKWKTAQFKSNLDFTGMPDIFELGYNSPVWDNLGGKCLSCGQCTMVCPTCNCYNVVDEMELGSPEGTRDRFW